MLAALHASIAETVRSTTLAMSSHHAGDIALTATSSSRV